MCLLVGTVVSSGCVDFFKCGVRQGLEEDFFLSITRVVVDRVCRLWGQKARVNGCGGEHVDSVKGLPRAQRGLLTRDQVDRFDASVEPQQTVEEPNCNCW